MRFSYGFLRLARALITAALPIRTAEPSLLPELSAAFEAAAQIALRRELLAFFVCLVASAAFQGTLTLPQRKCCAYDNEEGAG